MNPTTVRVPRTVVFLQETVYYAAISLLQAEKCTKL